MLLAQEPELMLLDEPVAGMTGTPAATASSRAATLLPSRRMVSGEGPMNTMPALAQASANSSSSAFNVSTASTLRAAFSEKATAEVKSGSDMSLAPPVVLGEAWGLRRHKSTSAPTSSTRMPASDFALGCDILAGKYRGKNSGRRT